MNTLPVINPPPQAGLWKELAIFADVGVTVLVMLNSLRLLGFSGGKE